MTSQHQLLLGTMSGSVVPPLPGSVSGSVAHIFTKGHMNVPYIGFLRTSLQISLPVFDLCVNESHFSQSKVQISDEKRKISKKFLPSLCISFWEL